MDAEVTERDVVAAVRYAMRSGCFFPVREPTPTASTRAWIQWGAMRHLHEVVARLSPERKDA